MRYGPGHRLLPRFSRGLLASILLLSIAGPIQSQSDGTTSTAGIVHPFSLGFENGDSAAPDTKIWDVRMPLSFNLIPLEDGRKWGLNLRVTIHAGIYDFQVDEILDLDVNFQSLAATPGVEFLVPAGEAWMLKPFTEIGGARDFDNNLSVGVWSFGLRTMATWPVQKIDLSLGTKIQYLSTFSSDFEIKNDFGEVLVGLDGSYTLPWEMSGNKTKLSIYAIRRQYIDAVVQREDGKSLEMYGTNEIGLAFDTAPKTRLWFFNLPRIGIGYRWGENIRGWRLNFGWPF